ncbi:restriction endonuclease PLD domain-containing protein [Melioribacter sp. Ez-97]|uniref:restriction endonuclease PLD domain-containing protein n=1 Tax=Melioribacter sp. Ez-97 TaxID=3423434 RepID=UPI003EDA290F
MISEDLFNELLIKPVKEGCNKLYIVSGYATSAMAFHHLEEVMQISENISIELIVGMCPSDGLALSNHRGFQQIMESDYKGRFKCSYITKMPPVHSKVYAWFTDDKPCIGFLGSANYTQTAFSQSRKEIMAVCDASEAYEYYNSLIDYTIYCTHQDTENLVQIYNDKFFLHKKRVKELLPDIETQDAGIVENITGLPFVTISFLDKNGNLPARSGLNWGQRPEEGREPNQAYIRLPSLIYNSDFFPPRKVHFTVLTDDSKILICSRAQENGKAIHTPHNNSLIGEYFRNRLGLASGAPVTKEDLLNYGRTDVTFYKIDDETYYMDFSV